MPFHLASNSVQASTPVRVTSVSPGENTSKNWVETADGANNWVNVLPSILTNGTPIPTSNKVLGAAGSAGDHIKSLILRVSGNTDSGVFLQDGFLPPVFVGTAATAPSGTTTFAGTSGVAVTVTVNQYAGQILTITYTPSGGVSTTIKRRIVSHGGGTSITAHTFVVDQPIPTGTNVTSWSLEQPSSFNVLPFNTTEGFYKIDLGITSSVGGWRISFGSQVSVLAVGKFS